MRYAIISDIHGNLDALDAVLADAGDVDQIWCLGDLVGYGPQPNECIARLRERGAICVAGNHDWAATAKIDTAEFNPEASEAAHWTREQLTADHRAYLDSLPEQLRAGPDGQFTLVHGSLRDPIWEYLTHPSLARPSFDLLQTPYCLVGHTHVPLVFVGPLPEDRVPVIRTAMPAPGIALPLGPRQLIVNPGSVGQPRDGNPDAAYMLYEDSDLSEALPEDLPDPSAPESAPQPLEAAARPRGALTLRRVTYPVATVQEKMRRAGLPARLVMRLSYGW